MPYKGVFRISQGFIPKIHNGLDLVGINDKNIHSINEGIVDYAGWENINDKLQGFGLYVRVRMKNGWYCYYGHLSNICVKKGDTVKEGTLLGKEGSTGKSTGSHLHLEIRTILGNKNSYIDIVDYTKIKKG